MAQRRPGFFCGSRRIVLDKELDGSAAILRKQLLQDSAADRRPPNLLELSVRHEAPRIVVADMLLLAGSAYSGDIFSSRLEVD